MTADDLSVYGHGIGSLWDRRIGGRYELTAITDTGGTGMWVTLQRVAGGHELAMSVFNLGRNYVPAPVAEPIEPDEDVPCDCSTCSYGRAHLAMYPNKPAVPAPSADVPLAAWEIELLNREADEAVELGRIRGSIDFGDLVRIGGEVLYRVVDADGKPILEPEPASTPPLPWIEHPDAWWWLPPSAHAVYRSRDMTNAVGADLWQRVAVIPWELIEDLRGAEAIDDTWEPLFAAVQAILDAADGAS